MHVTLTDFRDLARSVMDIGTKRPFWLLEDRALLIWKPTAKAALESPSAHIVERSKSLHIFNWNRATDDKQNESPKKKKKI